MEINPETDKPDKDGFSQKGCIRKMYANRWKRYWKKKRKKKKKGRKRTKKLCTKGAYKIRNFYAKSKIHEFTLPRKHKLIVS